MKLSLCSLSSGSSGNATVISGGNTRILIDAGLTGKQMEALLSGVAILPETISGILVTHEHSDHIKGVGVLARRYHLPVYANERTFARMASKVGEIPPRQVRTFETGGDFYVGDLAVQPIPIPHDAADPVAFRVFYGGRSVAVATDIGYTNKKLMKALSGTDLLIFESNHDPELLLNNDRYPAVLKQRILGRKGHLSNQSSAEGVLDLLEGGTSCVLLGHLSQDNNTPELAMETVSGFLTGHGVSVGRDCQLHITWRGRCGGVYTVE